VNGRDRRGDGGSAADRRAGSADRDESLYARKRARARRRRQRLERERFDPAPPTDDDWTVPDDEGDGVRRVGPPEPVGDALSTLIRQRGWEEALGNAALWSRWSDIVGEALADRCEPVRLRRGVLTVRAESQAWATQLRYLTTQLRRRAGEVLGGDPITDVVITVGPLEVGREPGSGAGPGGRPNDRDRPGGPLAH
jgi:hypothetical protein